MNIPNTSLKNLRPYLLLTGCLLWYGQMASSQPAQPDWQFVSALWQNFLKAPSAATAAEVCDALALSDIKLSFPDDDDFREDVFTGLPLVIEHIHTGSPWAIRLGLTLSDISGCPRWYETMTALSELASTHPRVFLEEMARYYGDDSDPGQDYGVVWFFASPVGVAEAAKQRADALLTVDDPRLKALRDRYVGFLRQIANPDPQPRAPQVIERVDVDPGVFSGIVVSGTLVVAEVTIAKDGSTKNVKLLRGVHPDVDQAFLEALRQWKYEPPLKDGEPSEFTFLQTLHINLQ